MPYVRREYISGKPQLKIARFSSGQSKADYDYKLELIVSEKMQIRHNALEAARLAANKRMAQAGDMSFFSRLTVYPHLVLRENKMIATAGADRLQEGMRRAFGKATGLAARQSQISRYLKRMFQRQTSSWQKTVSKLHQAN